MRHKEKRKLNVLKEDGLMFFLGTGLRFGYTTIPRKGCTRKMRLLQYLWWSKICKPMIIMISTQTRTRNKEIKLKAKIYLVLKTFTVVHCQKDAVKMAEFTPMQDDGRLAAAFVRSAKTTDWKGNGY